MIKEELSYILTPEMEKSAIENAEHIKRNHVEWRYRKNPDSIPPDALVLTDKERESALKAANRDQHNRIWFEETRKENREREAKRVQGILDKWNYAAFFKVMNYNCEAQGEGKLIFNEHTAPIIKAICFRLSKDKRYETEMGLSFDKMLIIRGDVGLGKSFIPSLVAENPVMPIQMVTMHEISRSVRETGQFKGMNFGKYPLIYLDDVGTEFEQNRFDRPPMHMGNPINWFRLFIENIYAKDKRIMSHLIISTNDSFDTLEKKYSFRVRDRLAEADVLDITGDSLRRKNK